MRTRFSVVKDALVRIDNEKRLYNYNDFEDPDDSEVRRRVNTKMDVLFMMSDLCCHPMCRLFFYNAFQRDALNARYINAIFDNKDNPFSVEHPLLADYIRNSYNRKISRIKINVFTRTYNSPLPDSARIWAFDWQYEHTQVYIDGKSMRRYGHIRVVSFLATVPTKHDWQHVQITRFKCEGTDLRYTKRAEHVALVLTPKKITK